MKSTHRKSTERQSTERQSARRALRSAAALAAAFTLSVLSSACGKDSGSPAETALSPSGSAGENGRDTTRNNPNGNAVAGIRINPRQLTLLTNGTTNVSVYPVDQNGIPSLALLAVRPVFSTGNASNNTDLSVRGVAAGTTKLYASVAGLKDSITVTVLAARDTTQGGTPTTPTTPTNPTNPPGPVSSFTLTVYAFGRATPTTARDTANVVQMAGANISVYRLTANPTVPSDSLGVRTLVTSAVADASGKAVIADLPSGFYSVVATATYQGAAQEGRSDFGPPRTADYATAVYLNRK